ncbi:ATP-dependent RecD-like DNA helicase [bacterium C-53]|nr:ATP-dependent RecD-like DNA helicase [Lachnospiraceae bacterium]NBI01650.1 ATP-dependent RecD-like DNA helicase [Lachnospiraceae bacterium]RKJ12944.1 ATP-dependent RecD-like DNA helicase [bacterium C-53]
METIEGFVDHIIYRNEENGYTVLALETQSGEETLVGSFRFIEEGESIRAEGEYGSHPVYGEQFKVKNIEIKTPDDVLSIEKYLASGAVKGIGESLARRIIKKFGEDSLRIMEEEPERLIEIKGISERIARQIAVQMEEKRELRKAMIFLQQYGISNALAVRIYDAYENKTYEVIRENPYRMTEEIAGIGFKTADEIAVKVGVPWNSDFRIRSGILYTLQRAMGDGHIYLPKEILLKNSSELMGIEETYIDLQLQNLTIENKIMLKTSEDMVQVYSSVNYYTELSCAKMLEDLNIHEEQEKDAVLKKIHGIEERTGICLEEKQREAVFGAVKNGVMIITGGPGTGKTTTINMLIHYFADEGMDIMLAAPTGRAAKRMTEATGYEAKTIHRLLELNGGKGGESYGNAVSSGFERNENNPLEADVIIVDEMSMVDIYLFYSLLKAVTAGTRLVLVGDVNQLPSVGPGAVLRDVISCDGYSVVALEKIFRQAAESDIVVNAHKVHEGKSIGLNNKSRDFFFLERDNAEVIIESIVYLVMKKLPPYVNAQPYEIQVMSPMRKGALGVENLNRCLQGRMNPPDASKKERESGEVVFREGDKVMQVKNNYQLEWEVSSKYGVVVDKGLGVFNGDMGVIESISDATETVTVMFDDNKAVHYTFSQLDELELAYAITIHKSQGSEYPAVIMPLLSGPAMLMNRNLLYTGITRAQKCVTMIGSSQTVNRMIENESEQKRYTGLKDRIEEFMEVR